MEKGEGESSRFSLISPLIVTVPKAESRSRKAAIFVVMTHNGGQVITGSSKVKVEWPLTHQV